MTAALPTIDVTDMLGVHTAFRTEFGALPGRIRDTGPDPVQAEVVAEHFDLLTAFLHAHHMGEDEVIWPLLQARAPMHQDLLDMMSRQHETLDALTMYASDACEQWRVTASPIAAAEFTDAIGELNRSMREHLAQEEVEILPIARQHMSVAEWISIGEHARLTLAPEQLAIILGMISEVIPAAGKAVLDDMPLDAQQAWLQFGRPAYAAYRARLDHAHW